MFYTELQEVVNGWVVKIVRDLDTKTYIYERLLEAQEFRYIQEHRYYESSLNRNTLKMREDAL